MEQGGEEIHKRNQRRVSAFLLCESLPTFSSGESRCPRGTSEWEHERRLREGEGARRDESGAHWKISSSSTSSVTHFVRATFPSGEGMGLCEYFKPLVMRWYRAPTHTTKPEQICAVHRSREEMCPESFKPCTLSGPRRLSSLRFFR